MINNVKGALGYNPDFSNTKINTEIPKFYDPTPLNINKLLGETMQETPKNLSYDDILNYVSQKNKSKNFFNDAYFLNKYEYDRFVNSDKDNNSFFNWKKNPIFKDPRYFDNEELNAQNQSGFRQLINGTSKMLPNAINAFVQGLNPLPGVRQGEFANWIKNWSEELEYTHPNYYSRKEKDNPFAFSSIMDGNFWGDKVLKNAGFTGGAILSAVAWDAGISLATGFTGTAPATAIAFGFALNNIKKKFTTVASVLRSVKGTGMIANASKSAITAYEGLKSYSTGQKALTLAKLGYLNYVGSNAESTIEGFEGLTSLNDKFIADFEQKNGRSPLAHEYASMKKIANEMANTRYAINLPLLMITNAIEFGTLFSPSKLLTTGGIGFGERIGVDAAGQLFKRGWKNFSKLEKAGRVLGSSPIKNFLAEGFQEGMQYSIEKATEDLGFKKYANPKFRVGLSEYMESQALGIQKTFSETEGLESMFIGGLTGLITSGGTSSWDKFVSKKSQKEDVILGENIDKYNELTKEGILNSEDFKEYISLAAKRDQINFDGTLTHTILDAQMQQAIEDNNAFAFKALQHDKLFNLVSVASKLGKVDAFKIKIDQLKDLSIDEFAQQMGLENLTDEQKEKLSDNIDQYIDVVKDKVDQMSEIVNTVDNSLLNTFDPKKDPINFNAFNELKNTFAYQLSNIDDIKGRMSEEMDDILSSKFNPLSQNMINGLIGEDLEEESLILDDFTKNFVTETGFDLSILDNKYAKAYTAQLNDISTQISLLNSQIETAKAAKLPYSGYASKLAEKKKELTNLTSFLTDFNTKINKFGEVLTLRKDFMHQESIDAYKDLTSHVVKHEMNKDLKNPMSLSKADDLVNAIADLHLLNSSLKLFVDKNNKFQTPKGQAEYIAQYTKWKDYAQNKVQEAVRKSKYETLRRTPEESINQLVSEIQTNLSQIESIKTQIEEIDKQLLDEKITDEEKDQLQLRKEELLKQKQELLDENKELEETKLVIEGKSKEDIKKQNTLDTVNNPESEIVERLSETILPNLGENLFSNISEKINKTKQELQKITQEVVTNNDLLLYLNNKLEFYLQKIINEQQKIDKRLENLPTTKYSKKQKQEKYQELINKHKDLLLAAQDIQDRISEIEKTNAIQKQEVEDLAKKIQYYQSILNTEKTHTAELQQKLATAKASLDKTNRLIEKTESYIDRLKSLLKEIVKAISDRLSILTNFLDAQGKNTPKLQEDITRIKTELLQESINGELFVEFNKLEKDVNDVLDHEEINQELLDKAELLLKTQIDKAIKLQNEIRYLGELFEENLEEVKKENTNPSSPQNKKLVEESQQENIPEVIIPVEVITEDTIPTEIINQDNNDLETSEDKSYSGKKYLLRSFQFDESKPIPFGGKRIRVFQNFLSKFINNNGTSHKENINKWLNENNLQFSIRLQTDDMFDENGDYFSLSYKDSKAPIIVLTDSEGNPIKLDEENNISENGNYIVSTLPSLKNASNETSKVEIESYKYATNKAYKGEITKVELTDTNDGKYNFLGVKAPYAITKEDAEFLDIYIPRSKPDLVIPGYNLMPGKLNFLVSYQGKVLIPLAAKLSKLDDIQIGGKNIIDLIHNTLVKVHTTDESKVNKDLLKDFLDTVLYTNRTDVKRDITIGENVYSIYAEADKFFILKNNQKVIEYSQESQSSLKDLKEILSQFDLNDRLFSEEQEIKLPNLTKDTLSFDKTIKYKDFILEYGKPIVGYTLNFKKENPFKRINAEIYFKPEESLEGVFGLATQTEQQTQPTINVETTQSDIKAKKADIERRNFLLSKEYKDFGWMSKQEKNDYLELQNSSKDKEDREKAYLKLRELYNKKVDKNFIDKVEKVHWVRNIESLISLLENGKTIPFEISTEGYFNESLKSGWGKGVGVKLKGDTLLASNEDLRSDNKYGSIEDKTFRKYSYGDATSMILNESSFLTHEWLEFEERGKKHQGHNEFLLKNSEIEAIVIDETNSKLTNEFRLEVENLSNRLGIPIIINAKYDAELKATEQQPKSNQSEIDKKADILQKKKERLANVKPMYHHTNVDTKDFNFNNFQRGNKQVSQFGDGLNASSNTTSFLVSRYGKPIQGEVNDADFVKIDASKTEKEVYEELKKQGYIFSEVHDTNDVLSEVPGAAMELFTDFQKSNPNVKGVRVSNHIIGNTKVAPFYVIYDAKSFYGQGALSKKN
jgi:hypothetical protein